MSRKTIFSLVATAAVLLSLLLAVGPANAQDPRGYYAASVATDTLVVDLGLSKSFVTRSAKFVTIESSADCTVTINGADGYSPKAEYGEAVADEINIFADTPKLLGAGIRTLTFVGVLGAELNVTAEY